jgi:hypothetical protein
LDLNHLFLENNALRIIALIANVGFKDMLFNSGFIQHWLNLCDTAGLPKGTA